MSDFNPWVSKDKTAGFQFFNDMHKIQNGLLQNAMHENMSLLSDSLSNYVRATQMMTKITKPEEFCKSEFSLLIEQGERMLEHGQNILKIMEMGLRDFRKHLDNLEHASFTEEDIAKEKKERH